MQTKDGYLLGLHRLQWRRGEEGQRVNSGPNSTRKRVIYMHHGLLMNSEVWVCQTDEKRCLAFELVEQGFDVWVSPFSPSGGGITNRSSLAIIAVTSTPKNQFTARPTRLASGTFPLTNLPSMIFPIASNISWKAHSKRAFRTLAFLRAPPKPLLRWRFTQSSTIK